MKNILSIICIIILLTSCKGTRFLNRKYTRGHFIEHIKTVKHNTFYSDSTKRYASTETGEIKNIITLSNIRSEKELIQTIINSIIKKDSIFIIRKKGRDKKIIVKNNLMNDTVYLNEDGQIILKNQAKTKKIIDPEMVKRKRDLKIKRASVLSIILSLIPGAGFVYAITTIHAIKKYRKDYYPERKAASMKMAIIGLLISLIPSLILFTIVLCYVLYVAIIFVALLLML